MTHKLATYIAARTLPFTRMPVFDNEDGAGGGVPGTSGEPAPENVQGNTGGQEPVDKDLLEFTNNPWQTPNGNGQGKPDTNDRTTQTANSPNANAAEVIDRVFNDFRVFDGVNFDAVAEGMQNGDSAPLQEAMSAAMRNAFVGQFNVFQRVMQQQLQQAEQSILQKTGDGVQFANSVDKLKSAYPELMDNPMANGLMVAALKQARTRFKDNPAQVSRAMEAIADKLRGGFGTRQDAQTSRQQERNTFEDLVANILG